MKKRLATIVNRVQRGLGVALFAAKNRLNSGRADSTHPLVPV